MKVSNTLIISGLAMALTVASAATAATTVSCPADFKLKPSTPCMCSATNQISCKVGGELMVASKIGVDVDGTTLKTASGVSVKCAGDMWGVMMVHHRHIGFRCQQ